MNKAINNGQPLGGKTYHGWHFPKNYGTLESNFHRPPACNLVDKSLPYVGLDTKHWEQPTFYCQHQVHKRGTKHAAKTVMKLETGSSTGLHEDKIQQGAQHFSSFPGSWHHLCQRQKVAVGNNDCLENRRGTEHHATALSSSLFWCRWWKDLAKIVLFVGIMHDLRKSEGRGIDRGHCSRLHPGTGTTRALLHYRNRSRCLESGRHREDWPRGLRSVC